MGDETHAATRGNPDPYALLGVTSAATSVEINEAFQAKLRALRNDARKTDSDPVDDIQLQQILTAYVQLRQDQFDEIRDAGGCSGPLDA